MTRKQKFFFLMVVAVGLSAAIGADTIRTRDTLITDNFKAGQVKGIGSQDFRDLIVSSVPKYTAADPTVNSDVNAATPGPYGVGSLWINTSDSGVFICTNATDGAAVWNEIKYGAITAGELPNHSTDLLTSGTLAAARGGTGITSLGSGVATFLGTPSSANLAAAITDETGTDASVFANTPTLVTPVIGAATGTSLLLNSSTAYAVPSATTGRIHVNSGTGLTFAGNGSSYDLLFTNKNGSTVIGIPTGTATTESSGEYRFITSTAFTSAVADGRLNYNSVTGLVARSAGSGNTFTVTTATGANVLQATATGNTILGGGATASDLRLLEASGSGTNYASFSTPPLAANTVYVLPVDDGDAGEQLQTNGSGTLSWELPDSVSALSDGVWTPTLTNDTNVAASTAYQGQYMRVGSTVTFSVRVDIDPTLAATATVLRVSLPVASNLSAIEKCVGTGTSPAVAGLSSSVVGNPTNDDCEIRYVAPADVSNWAMYIQASYRVQ